MDPVGQNAISGRCTQLFYRACTSALNNSRKQNLETSPIFEFYQKQDMVFGHGNLCSASCMFSDELHLVSRFVCLKCAFSLDDRLTV